MDLSSSSSSCSTSFPSLDGFNWTIADQELLLSDEFLSALSDPDYYKKLDMLGDVNSFGVGPSYDTSYPDGMPDPLDYNGLTSLPDDIFQKFLSAITCLNSPESELRPSSSKRTFSESRDDKADDDRAPSSKRPRASSLDSSYIVPGPQTASSEQEHSPCSTSVNLSPSTPALSLGTGGSTASSSEVHTPLVIDVGIVPYPSPSLSNFTSISASACPSSASVPLPGPGNASPLASEPLPSVAHISLPGSTVANNLSTAPIYAQASGPIPVLAYPSFEGVTQATATCPSFHAPLPPIVVPQVSTSTFPTFPSLPTLPFSIPTTPSNPLAAPTTPTGPLSSSPDRRLFLPVRAPPSVPVGQDGCIACPHPGCSARCSLNKIHQHILGHGTKVKDERRRCPVHGCLCTNVMKKGDWARHIENKHLGLRRYLCTDPECQDQGPMRRDQSYTHMAIEHRILIHPDLQRKNLDSAHMDSMPWRHETFGDCTLVRWRP